MSDALRAGLDCEISPSEAAGRIESVADNRQSILQQLSGYTAPTAHTDMTVLQRALQNSIEADRHYRDGFRGFPPGASCQLPTSASFDQAHQSDRRATAAKKLFVDDFDPLAEELGRRTWNADEF